MAKGTTFRFLGMPEYAEIYYKNADKHATDYVKTFPEDVRGNEEILKDLSLAVMMLLPIRIMDEYWEKQHTRDDSV